MENKLTLKNYNQGFLVDEQMMAGVTLHPDVPGSYAAFILSHATGEYLGYELFSELNQALNSLNNLPRDWSFEKIGGCGGGNCGSGGCGESGQCNGGSCNQGSCSVL